MAFHPIVDANHAWRLSITIWSLHIQSSACFVRKKNEQKETDHIPIQWNCGLSFFCSIFILPLQTRSSSEILISVSVYLLVCFFAQCVYNTSAAWYFEWGERRGGMRRAFAKGIVFLPNFIKNASLHFAISTFTLNGSLVSFLR